MIGQGGRQVAGEAWGTGEGFIEDDCIGRQGSGQFSHKAGGVHRRHAEQRLVELDLGLVFLVFGGADFGGALRRRLALG